MASDSPDKPEHKTFPKTRRDDNPTVRAFAAVKPPDPVHEMDTDRDAPTLTATNGELALAVIMLADQVEKLGGDVSEIRAMLHQVPKK